MDSRFRGNDGYSLDLPYPVLRRPAATPLIDR
jgi:hypothetical protein